MAWLEVSVRVDAETAEAVAELFGRYAPGRVALDFGDGEGPVTVLAYLRADERLEERRRRIEEGLWHLGQIAPVPPPRFNALADRDWTAGWKARIPVLHLGERVVIKPSWRTYVPRADEIVLEMDPGLAFGTGMHPTTQLCVAMLEATVRPGMRVLDVGTGTGILAMVAARLGAGEVVAVDTDADAVTAARRNFRANGVLSRIRLAHGSLPQAKGRFDVVVANILAPVIRAMVEEGLATRLRPQGTLIASGILVEQAPAVEATMARHGLRVVEQREQEDWVALRAVRSD